MHTKKYFIIISIILMMGATLIYSAVIPPIDIPEKTFSVVLVESVTGPLEVWVNDTQQYTAVSNPIDSFPDGKPVWTVAGDGASIVGSSTGTSVQVKFDIASQSSSDKKTIRATWGTSYKEINVVVGTVSMTQTEFDILRQRSVESVISNIPDSFSLAPDIDIGEYDPQIITPNYNSSQKKIAITNNIYENDPLAYVDEVMVDIIGRLPDKNLGPIKLNLQKESQDQWDNIRTKGVTYLNDLTNLISAQGMDFIRPSLTSLNNCDPEFPLGLHQHQIDEAVDYFGLQINNLIVDKASTFLNLPISEVPKKVVPESTTWTWNLISNFLFHGGTISVPLEIKYTDWFNTIRAQGFDSKIFEFLGITETFKFDISGSSVKGQWGFSGTGTVSYTKYNGNNPGGISYGFTLSLNMNY